MIDILAALQSEMDNLSRSEQRIAEILFADTDFAVNASIIELAARAEVSPPTVTRFCRRLDCQSFSEFKVRLAQSTFVGSRYIKPETEELSLGDAAETVITNAQTALYNVHNNLDEKALEQAVNRIANASMVYAFGSGGNSSMVAAEVQNRLFRLGIRVTTCIDHGMQLMLAASAKPNDVLIASSVSGRNSEMARALLVARDYKVPTIALTRPDSEVAEAADLVLPIDLPEGSNILLPTAARYAYLAMLDILATMTAIRLRASATETLRRIKHQVVAFRDKDDTEALGD